ncbi:hypothetical protein PybrP1_012502 [[Pythium] brassicae (nom. inval.)]|nr:hypothetical protein PybrP1_012502 [[Pythium] brassicae (nom. inval.)]
MDRKEQERAWIEARKLRLVGSVLAASDQELFVEATFATHFGQFFRQLEFWGPFEQACCAVFEGRPWSVQRQLMLSYSLPQEVNAKDPRGETMLTLAAASGRAKVVSILCQIKADPKIENAKGWSTVHVAAAYNHVSVLEVLLALGVGMNEPDLHMGYTALHLAASVDNLEALQCLHASGKADFDKQARNGFTVLHVAAAHGSERCVAFLLRTFPDLKYRIDTILYENPAHKAAKHMHPRVYKQLVASGTRDDLENAQDDSASDLAIDNSRYSY